MCKTADYGLRKPKMPRVLNGNLIVLKWQNIHVISNIKYTTIYSKTLPRTLRYIQQRRIQNPFKRQKQSYLYFLLSVFDARICKYTEILTNFLL